MRFPPGGREADPTAADQPQQPEDCSFGPPCGQLPNGSLGLPPGGQLPKGSQAPPLKGSLAPPGGQPLKGSFTPLCGQPPKDSHTRDMPFDIQESMEL